MSCRPAGRQSSKQCFKLAALALMPFGLRYKQTKNAPFRGVFSFIKKLRFRQRSLLL
ncbi:MAG: YccF domain-containing protein [Ruminococcaceae bacterium]|nr:YccF domain-containing protein [Oscillospiraceae bacterium]